MQHDIAIGYSDYLRNKQEFPINAGVFTSRVDVDDEVRKQFVRRDDPEFRELLSRRPELFTAEIVDRAAATERNLFGVSSQAIRCRLCLTGRC